MRRRKRIALAVSGVCAVLLLGVGAETFLLRDDAADNLPVLNSNSRDEAKAIAYQTGEIEKEAFSKESVVLIRGEHICVESAEAQAISEKYKLSGEQNAYKKAVRFLLEREALYWAAEQAGYFTTSEEAQKIVGEMRESFHQAVNFDVFLEYLDGAGMSEEEYWTGQVDIVAKERTMEKFVNAQKAQLSTGQGAGEQPIEEQWEEKKQQIIDGQIKQEHIRAVVDVPDVEQVVKEYT